MLFRRFLLLCLVLSVVSIPARAEELTREKRANIERLLDMTGALALGRQMASAVVTSLTQELKKTRPDIPENALNLLPAEVVATFDDNIGTLREAIIPIYHKHFTDAEIKEMIRFYSSELGQKTIRVMPVLVQEGMAVGQRWGQSLGPQIQQRVTAKLRQQGVKI